MRLSRLACLLTGSLLVLIVACRSERPELPATSSSEQTQPAESPAGELSTPQPTEPAPATLPEAPTPTAMTDATVVVPTPDTFVDVPPGWKVVGSEEAGVQMGVPESWVDLVALLDTPEAITRLGPTVRLVIADTKETGNRLFSGTEGNAAAVGNGAFGIFWLDTSLQGSAETGLQQALGSEANFITPVQPLAVNGLSGAVAEVLGNPLGFLPLLDDDLHLRVLTLPLSTSSGGQWLAVFGAAANRWNNYEPLFSEMINSLYLPGGPELVSTVLPRTVVGTLTSGAQVTGNLANSDTDTWLFTGQSGTYATISLIPESSATSDFILTLIDPAGKTIEILDGGFAGDSEVLVDILLYRTGTYQIQVSEFFRQPGRYTLRLFVADQPQFAGGGRITIGQQVDGELPAAETQTWVFEGSAGQTVSIILTPQNSQFDAILEVVGPDGTSLVNLDEGFSGDAEVTANLALSVTGEYVIVVQEFNERGGPYTLSLNEGGTALTNFYDAGDISYGEVKSETLQANEAHAWFFIGEAGDEVTLVVTPLAADADLTVWLLDPNLQRLVMQDEFFYGETETIVYTLPTAGQYVILVQEFFGEMASYQVVLTGGNNASVELAGNIGPDETVEGIIPLDKEVVWVFAAQAGDVITVTLRPLEDHSDMVLVLRDPDNNVVLDVDNALAGEAETIVRFTITTSGEWTILLQEFFDEEGAYELTLTQTTP